MNFKTLTLCTLLGFSSLTGLDDIALAANDPIECKAVEVIPEYSEFLGSLKLYFEGVDEMVGFLATRMNDTDMADEREVLLLHMLFIQNQIEMMKMIQPNLDKTYKYLFYELGPYGG